MILIIPVIYDFLEGNSIREINDLSINEHQNKKILEQSLPFIVSYLTKQKESQMKEKITITLVLTATLGLLIYHQSQTNELAVKAKNNSPIIQNQNTEIIEDEFIGNQTPVEISTVDSSLPLVSEIGRCKECDLEATEINSLTFSEAFKHYKACLGIGGIFTWNGVDYLIEIAEEQEILFADSVNVDKEQLSQK